MSAFITLTDDDCVTILTDGASCDPENDYALSSLDSKIWPMPHISSVLLWTGATTVARILILWCQKHWTSFDRMIEVLPSNLRDAAASAQKQFPERNATTVIVVSGWSNRRQRFETYSLLTDAENLSELPELTVMPRLAFSPSLDTADIEAAVEKFGSGWKVLYEFMEIQRLQKQVPASTKDHEEIYTVGGFIQETVLTKDYIETKIARRWPDLIGVRLDPTRADAAA